MNVPKRGEIWLAHVGGATRLRPCLVLSDPALDEPRSLATVIPATTRPRGSRFEIKAADTRSLPTPTFFDVTSLVTVSAAHLEQRTGLVDPETMTNIESAVRTWLGL